MVPDTVEQLDVIVGCEWLDMLAVEYRKVDGQLHMNRAELCSCQIESIIMTVGCDADYLHVVEKYVMPDRLRW